MQKQSHVDTLKKLYSHFKSGNSEGVLELCSENLTFQVSGKSLLAGKYTKVTFGDLILRLREFSQNTFQFEIHDILASTQHATVLMTCRLEREGRAMEYRSVHVWRFEGDRPLAGYEYTRDLYQFDSFWSV